MRNTDSKSDARILFEAEILHDFPKRYLPERIYMRHAEDSPVDLDRYVKYYMIWRGIDNVRGGSYTDFELPEYQQRTLMEEMNTASVEYELSGLFEYAAQPHTRAELKERLELVQANYNKYLKEKRAEIKLDTAHIQGELKWLKSECENQKAAHLANQTNNFLYTVDQDAAIKRYRELVILLQKVRTIVKDVLGREICAPLILHPEFVCDDFIYHHHRIHLPVSAKNLTEIVNTYTNYINQIENRKAERDFDIASWGLQPDKDMPNEIYLFKKMLSKLM